MLDFVRKACLIGGLIPALGSAVYKGVLFSTSSQPSWKDARWLGGYLVNGALMLGAAELLAIARVLGQDRAADLLRPALLLLLAIHAVPLALLIAEFRPGLERTHSRDQLIGLGALAIGLGLIVPVALTLAVAGPLGAILGLVSLLAGALAIRRTIVMIPHWTE